MPEDLIHIPAWIDAPILALPDVPLRDFFAEGASAIGATRKIRGAADLIGVAAQAAELAMPAAGPAVMAVSGVLSFFEGFFSPGPRTLIPPAPQIAGEDANEVTRAPLDGYSRAIAVGLLVGKGGGPPGLDAAAAALHITLLKLRTASFEEVGRQLRAENRPYSILSTSLFAATCDYEYLFDPAGLLGSKDNAAPLGRLLALGAPRLRALTLIKLAHYWRTRVWLEKNRGQIYDFSPHGLRDDSRSASQWLNMFVVAAFPRPVPHENGAWSYSPLDGAVLRAVVNLARDHPYYDYGPGGRRLIAFPGELGKWLRRGELESLHTVTTSLTYEEALNLALRTGAAEFPDHIEDVKGAIAEMRAASKARYRLSLAARAVVRKRHKDASEKALRQRRGSGNGLLIGGAAAAAAAVLLLR